MPELPEVETVCRGLHPVLPGCRLARVEARRRDLRRPLPVDFASRLTGRRVEAVERRGKYILMPLDSGETVIAHLGMSGRMVVKPRWPEPPGQHDHILMETESGETVVFNDPRRFGLMTLAGPGEAETHPLLTVLGPDPLSPRFDGVYLGAGLAGRRGAVKPALLDQSLAAGVGNIYACEALHQARLSPVQPAGNVQGGRAALLAEALGQILRSAIEAGGSSLRDHRRPDGELGYFQHQFAVYGRDGASCQRDCGGVIVRIKQAGRSTFYCPACQT